MCARDVCACAAVTPWQPYLGVDLFRRQGKDDRSGSLGSIGARLAAQTRRLLDAASAVPGLPTLTSVHLFVGSAATLYHCHYDLNPNLHVQAWPTAA